MLRTTATTVILGFTSALGAAVAAEPSAGTPGLSAAQIVERVVAARGGAAAWHELHSLTWKGKMGAGATHYEVVTKGKLETRQRDESMLPFTFDYQRPLKTRLEIQFSGQTAVQVYDGASGWKLRPYLGRAGWDAYSADELRQAQVQPGIDGYLIDYAAKGARVELAGTERVEDQLTYKLKVTQKGGQVRHVWVNSSTFLETKVEGEPRRLDGKPHNVEIFLREYRSEGRLVMPHLIETRVNGVAQAEKIVIDSVTVNPKLDDARFTKST